MYLKVLNGSKESFVIFSFVVFFFVISSVKTSTYSNKNKRNCGSIWGNAIEKRSMGEFVKTEGQK
jgi:hypothetical protein